MIDIPPDFYSEYSGQPFDTCVDCGTDLLDGETPYLILKHVVARETVFEMAICLPCATILQQEYSEESKQAIQGWISEHLNSKPTEPHKEDHHPKVIKMTDGDVLWGEALAEPQLDLEHCQLCRKPRSQAHRYVIEAVCVGNSLILTKEPSRMLSLPLLVCETCTEDVSDLISEKTRDQWNRFVEDHFDGPPGIEADPSNRDLMLV